MEELGDINQLLEPAQRQGEKAGANGRSNGYLSEGSRSVSPLDGVTSDLRLSAENLFASATTDGGDEPAFFEMRPVREGHETEA